MRGRSLTGSVCVGAVVKAQCDLFAICNAAVMKATRLWEEVRRDRAKSEFVYHSLSMRCVRGHLGRESCACEADPWRLSFFSGEFNSACGLVIFLFKKYQEHEQIPFNASSLG